MSEIAICTHRLAEVATAEKLSVVHVEGTLLIAESPPSSKDLMVRLVVNLLVDRATVGNDQ